MTSQRRVLWALVALSLVLMSTTLVEYDQILGSENRPIQTSTVSVVSNQTITVTPPTSTISVLSTRTITTTLSQSTANGSSVVTEAVIVQEQAFGDGCLMITATVTSTLYLTPSVSTFNGFPSSTTTETFSESPSTTINGTEPGSVCD